MRFAGVGGVILLQILWWSIPSLSHDSRNSYFRPGAYQLFFHRRGLRSEVSVVIAMELSRVDAAEITRCRYCQDRLRSKSYLLG